MSVNAREQWELEFVDGLVEAGNDNMKLTGGDDDRRQAMWNIANPIIKAIKRGVATIHFVGSFSVTQLNALQSKEQNGIYGVTDDGLLTNPDGTTLQVTAGSSVMWDGSWREFLDIDLSGYYTKEQVDSLIATAVAEFTAAVANESSLRESADATLQGNIDAEASERSSADNALDERVAYLEEATSSYEVNSNKVNAIDDSTAHYPTTHAVTAAIGAEATARESADSALGARIDGVEDAVESEVTEREEGDRDLQSQIDAISSKSDVVDVVASYAELVAYDTSALGDNDVVKVLEDETHDDAESYYRWNLTTQTWGYIGSQGPFVTPAEMQTALNGKVDKVSGKGLSTNDYTTADKNKLEGIEAGAQVNNIFVAVYIGAHNNAGNTPYADIYAAYQAGKRIMCWNDAGNALRLYTLNGFNYTDKIFKFTSCGGSGEDIVEVTFQYLAGNINDTECRTNLYPLAKRNHASTTTDYGTGDATHYGHVKVDSSLSDTSTNPVQNKVIKDALDKGVAISLQDMHTTIAAEVQSRAPSYKHMQFYTLTSGGSYYITDLPLTGRSFCITANLKRHNNDSDYAYSLSAWMLGYAYPWVCEVTQSTSACVWERVPGSTDVPYIIDAASATTAVFDEAVSRYQAGKLVFIRSSPHILQCVGAVTTQMLFESVGGGTNGISKGVINWYRGASVPSITWLNAAARDGSNATGTWGINISGNAASATHLSTPRNLKVNLASENAQPFDGSTNAESVGVSGALPIPHGGTGATTPAGALTNLGLGNFSPGTRIGLYGLEIFTTEVVDIALSGKVYDTTLFVEYCRSSSDADGHHPALLAISFRYIEDQDDKWVSTPRMAVLYSFNAADKYFKPELKYTADGHILLNLSASRRHTGQVTIIASSANCSFITVSKLAMSSSVWTGATAVTDVRVSAIDDAVVHKAGDETITGVKTVSTSGKVGFIVQDDKDARLKAQQTGVSNRYIQLDVESGDEGDNVAVYARNGNTNGSYLVSIDSSTVNTGGRGVCGLGQKTDTVVRLGSKKLDFSGTMGSSADTVYFV